MGKFILTEEQKEELEHRHSEINNGKEKDRIKAVLLRSEGWSMHQIAQALRIHIKTVSRHLNDYKQKEKLKLESGGSESKLSQDQTEQLIAHMTEHTYHHQKDIVAYIEKRWNIVYSVSGLNKWLRRNGFSYKKPKGVPGKLDPVQQAEFIKKYKALKASLKENDGIYFMDSVHPTQATKLSSGWIRKGTDKAIKTTASRTRVNLVGAIRLEKLSQTVTETYDKINGDSVASFLQHLRSKSEVSGTLHLIIDCAGYHKAQAFKEKAKELNIKLHYLPPYSPNLNPIERLWKVMNEHVRNNRFFEKPKEFRQKIQHFFEKTLPDIGHTLDSRINDNFQFINQTF